MKARKIVVDKRSQFCFSGGKKQLFYSFSEVGGGYLQANRVKRPQGV